jgi:hypothetical protein
MHVSLDDNDNVSYLAGAQNMQPGHRDKEAELPLWEADWDDEDVGGGDFVQHLKKELAKKS